ncbi:Universal stress protein phos34 [Turnera subulata]|uniref:Universal stress protein phos34 n=1 Tax=Turnera subulata TaxID=218843 RepID=A0A9Q0JGE9_9ROSI|nr:Universal stress protein phos34 [Turnera subulata]
MNANPRPDPDLPVPPLPTLRVCSGISATNSPTPTPTAGAQRRIAIAVDLSEESAYAVAWAVDNYLRPGDAVILLHVRPTSVLYGADWGSLHLSPSSSPQTHHQHHRQDASIPPEALTRLEDDFDNFTNSKALALAKPLIEAEVPYKIHIVKDHDLKERLCLEVERLGLSAMIMGSRGFGGGGAGAKRGGGGRLGSVSDYCVHHCVCPVVVVRDSSKDAGGEVRGEKERLGDELELHPVPEVEPEQEEQELEEEDGLDEQRG